MRQFFTEGDNVVLKTTIKDRADGSVIDLTGSTVRLRYRFNQGPSTRVTATITDAMAGVAQYTFTGDGLPDTGIVEWLWEVDDGTSTNHTDTWHSREVRRKL